MTAEYLDVAHRLGNRLVGTAIWHEDRCNWMGVRPIGNVRSGIREAVAALDGDLYSGTSGIALFLAELHAFTGDEVVARTALGAIRHAIARSDIGDTMGSGLYDGRLGTALAAARVGTLLHEGELLERAGVLAEHAQPLANNFDLISGRAGAIVGLIVLCKLLDDHRLLEAGVRIGDELVAMAAKEERCYTWSGASSRPLTGLAHGAAGVGYALLELFESTGQDRYRRAAGFAFAYEREHFSPDAQNWPDFRHARGRRRRLPPVFATQWCHGAPGIALSRLRAYQLVEDETSRAEAVAGVMTTRRLVESNVARDSANYCLCHGLAGNAEVLLHAEQILGPGRSHGRALAERVADNGIERFAAGGRPWPCGAGQGVSPSLMIGVAGIGHFYLRLHDPRVPSMLLLRPDAFAVHR